MTPYKLAPWWDLPWLVYDLETTGLDIETAHVVQIGLVKMVRGEVTARKDILVRPPIDIPEEATKIHGITNAMVADAMCETEALGRMQKALASHHGALVNYNGFNYDDEILVARAGNSFFADVGVKPRVDLLTIIRSRAIGQRWPGKGRHKLSSVAGRFRIELGDDDRLHWATSDCVLTGKILWHLVNDSAYKAVKKLPPDYGVTAALQALAAKQQAEFDAWLAKQPPLPKEGL